MSDIQIKPNLEGYCSCGGTLSRSITISTDPPPYYVYTCDQCDQEAHVKVVVESICKNPPKPNPNVDYNDTFYDNCFSKRRY
jgi:hypothetical protein